MDSKFDDEYRDKINKALIDAVFRASMVGDVAHMRTGEIVDAALSLIAMMSAGSDETASPAKRRHFVEVFSKKLLRRIVSFQEHVAVHGWPYPMVNLNEKDIH